MTPKQRKAIEDRIQAEHEQEASLPGYGRDEGRKQTKIQILALHEKGVSTREIANRLSMSEGNVRFIIRSEKK